MRMTKNAIILFVLLFPKLILAQQTEAFHKIKVYGKIEVRIQNSPQHNVELKADSIVSRNVSYKVNNGELHIKADSPIPRQTNVTVVVSCSNVDTIEIGGGAKCYSKGTIETKYLYLEAGAATELDLLIDVDSVSSRISKNGFIRLTGKAESATIKTTTGGSYAADAMECKRFYATMNGGVARAKVEQKIEANLSQKSTLLYLGTPKIIEAPSSKGEITLDQE